MPHMPVATLIPLIMKMVDQILPLIQQLLDSNNRNSYDYEKDKKSVDDFLKGLNEELKRLDHMIKETTGQQAFPFSTNPVNSAEEATALAAQFRELADKPEFVALKDQLLFQAKMLDKAAADLTAENRIKDPDGKLVLQPGASSWVPDLSVKLA